ncbi:hypothetical protein TH63_15465 [Rufibacter radiotolerans]|uniref:DUF2911 domain-containing protein n=1 Tax=Rufibacter radiotolerans TaxID=1379910 RepID=A0A0H4VN09_9BACT|nr:DUF2911 domain-containing protein [Rufibacter radiotolerans]AKQ46703.1 hypothetical protein TH63_15465 [Rufibacter radiotolerans]
MMYSKTTFPVLLTALSLAFLSCEQKPAANQVPATVPQSQTADSVTTTQAFPVDSGAVVIQVQPEADTLKGSLKAVATGKIGTTNLQVNYHSPAVRNRMIWGGLVAYDRVWVTGAHSATSLQIDGPITIGGVQIPAGKYALFTIPGRDQWTVIINKNWEQHLADKYSEKEDLVRISVKPTKTAQKQERLRYEITPESDTKGSIDMTWEKVKISVPVSL